MFARRISIQRIDASGAPHPCPIRWIDNFAMRNFTNDPVFDDTLPGADGLLEAGYRVPLDRLQPARKTGFAAKDTSSRRSGWKCGRSDRRRLLLNELRISTSSVLRDRLQSEATLIEMAARSAFQISIQTHPR
jgi:hypothetical protein